MSVPTIQRIVLKNKDVYEVGQFWPGMGKENGSKIEPEDLVVGPIFFLKEFTETYPQLDEKGKLRTDVNNQPTREAAAESEGAHYEVWCVPFELLVGVLGSVASDLLGGNFQVDRQKLGERLATGTILRRRFFTDVIGWADDRWETAEAFEEMARKFKDLDPDAGGGGDDDDEFEEGEVEEEGEPEPAPALEAGNGTTTPAVLPPATP